MRKLVLYLFHALFLLVPLYFSAKTEELFEFNKIILTYVITALIVGAWVSRMVIEKRKIFRRTPFDIPILIFFVSQLIATVFSIHARTSWFGYYSRFNGGLLSIVTYIALYYAFLSNVKKVEVRSLLNTLLYGAFVTAFYAIPEHFGHSFSCQMIAGTFTVDCWIQDVQSRIFGTFGQPNWLAAYMLMMIPLSIAHMIAHWKKPLWAMIYSLFTASYFLTLLFTASRSGLFGLVAGLVVFGGLYLLFSWVQQKAQFKLNLVPVFTSVVLLLVLFQVYGGAFTPTINALIEKFQFATGVSLPRKALSQPDPAGAPVATESAQPVPVSGTQLDAGGTESGVIRSIVWRGAVDVWRSSTKNFWVGSGVETFAYSYYNQRPVEHNMVSEWDFLYNKAHNELLNYLATTGILGLGSYLLMIGWIYAWTLTRLWKQKSPEYFFVLAWIGAYTGLHISNFLGFSTVMVSILFYLTPSFILLHVDTKDTLESEEKRVQLSNSKMVWIGLIFFITLYTVWGVIKWWRADVAYAQGKQFVHLQQAVPAIQSFQKAIALAPNEATFHDEYAITLANIAGGLAEQQNATQAAQFAQEAAKESDTTIALNPVHLNFYKSRARLFIILSSLEPALLREALATLEHGRSLAPTDPKLVFNQAVVLKELGQTEQAIDLLEYAVALKPNYGVAVNELKNLTQPSAER